MEPSMDRKPRFVKRPLATVALLVWLLLLACGFVADAAASSAVPQPDATSTAANVAAPTWVPVPPFSGHVVDAVGYLSTQDRAALEAKLVAFEKSKGRQIAVLLVQSIGDEGSQHYAYRVFDAWKLGVNDILVLVTTEPYDEDITPGRGLVMLTPAILKRVLDEDMSWPRVKLGDINGELNGGIDRLIKLENGEAMPPPPKPEGDFTWTLLDAIAPPPLEMTRWLGLIVGLPFVFIFAVSWLGGKAALLRGGVTLAVVWLFVLWLGAGWLFALVLGALACHVAMRYDPGELPEYTGSTAYRSGTGNSFGSIVWSLFKIAGSGALGSGGGSGFRGGGGGFGGGGASGSW
ncbi:MAG: TPM domain-containing protein [Proteobacteria bacterium]|nr:TPM domain-containing protein [Pseudomonadota bacterium]